MTPTRVMAAIGCALIVGIAGCSGTDAGLEASGSGGDGGGAADVAYRSDDALLEGPRGGSARGRTAALPSIGPAVIKNATLELEVAEGDFQSAVGRGIAIAERYGGFVVSTSVEDVREGRGSIVLRVPVERFGAALTALEELGEINAEHVSGQDVTEEFIDLEARLRNLTAQERVILGLMREANSISESITVQRELEDLQLEIERIRGRIRFLRDQTAMGTIEVNMFETDAAPARVGELQRAWRTALDTFISVIAGLIASLGVIVPLLGVFGAAVLIYMRLRPKEGL